MVVRSCLQRKKMKKKRSKTKYPEIETLLRNLFLDKGLKYYSLYSIQQSLPYDSKPSLSWIRECLRKLKISRRKFNMSKLCNKNKQQMEDLMKQFNETITTVKDEEFACIDETGFCNVGNSCFGYFQKGKQPNTVIVPKRKRVSVIMTITNNSVVSFSSQVKPFNSESFYKYIEQTIPKLPSTVKLLLMDNVSFHKTKKLKELVMSKGLTLLFIPPYSPRCNPIEEVFSIMKRYFRVHYNQNFDANVLKSIDHIQSCSDFQGYYNHTRQYVSTFNSI